MVLIPLPRSSLLSRSLAPLAQHASKLLTGLMAVGTMTTAGALAACDPGTFQGELPPCVCDNGGCTASACPMTITLDSTCEGEMSFAEVLVDDHVETAPLKPLEPLLTCSRVEPGDQAVLWVRGGPWVWGPLTERCDVAGENQQIVLQCVEAR